MTTIIKISCEAAESSYKARDMLKFMKYKIYIVQMKNLQTVERIDLMSMQ